MERHTRYEHQLRERGNGEYHVISRRAERLQGPGSTHETFTRSVARGVRAGAVRVAEHIRTRVRGRVIVRILHRLPPCIHGLRHCGAVDGKSGVHALVSSRAVRMATVHERAVAFSGVLIRRQQGRDKVALIGPHSKHFLRRALRRVDIVIVCARGPRQRPRAGWHHHVARLPAIERRI